MTSWRECPFLAKVCADQFLPVFGVGPCGAFRSFECCGQVCNIRLAARNVHSFCPDLTCFATKIRRCSLWGFVLIYLPFCSGCVRVSGTLETCFYGFTGH